MRRTEQIVPQFGDVNDLDHPVRMKLQDIALTDQPQPVRPHGQRILDSCTADGGFVCNPVDELMLGRASGGVDAVGELPFQARRFATCVTASTTLAILPAARPFKETPSSIE